MKVSHPLAIELFEIAKKSKTTISEVARRAGIERANIARWKKGTVPTVANLDAALNALGYQLVILRKPT